MILLPGDDLYYQDTQRDLRPFSSQELLVLLFSSLKNAKENFIFHKLDSFFQWFDDLFHLLRLFQLKLSVEENAPQIPEKTSHLTVQPSVQPSVLSNRLLE